LGVALPPTAPWEAGQRVGFWPFEEIFLVLVLQKQKCAPLSLLLFLLPSCEISEALDTTRQHRSSPKHSRGVALRRYGKRSEGR